MSPGPQVPQVRPDPRDSLGRRACRVLRASRAGHLSPSPRPRPAGRVPAVKAASGAVPALESGMALAFTPVRLFASAVENAVKVQQQTWASLTGLTRGQSRNY